MEKTFLSIKLVIFSVIDDRLKVYLEEDRLPENKLEADKSLDEVGRNIFQKNLEVALRDIYFEQLYTFSGKEGIAVVYYFLVPEYKISPNSKKRFKKYNIDTSRIDREIILYAVQRLRWKIEYTNVVYSLLPNEFTFSQLQNTYEAILGKTLDKRNFRKKMLSLSILKDTGHVKNLGKARPALTWRGRPAEMFSFRKKEVTFVKILQPRD